MSKIKKGPGIIVAIDDPHIDEIYRVSREISHAKGNFVLKVGRTVEMEHQIGIISGIKFVSGLPVIYDGKIADIPPISARIAEKAYTAGADAVIVHGFVGLDVVEAVVNLDMGDVIVVVEMSNPGWYDLHFHHGEMISGLMDIGIDGVVLPATRPDLIQNLKSMLDEDVYIISPGIGAQGASAGDGFSGGADYEIIGRTLCGSYDVRIDAEYYYDWGEYWARDRRHNDL